MIFELSKYKEEILSMFYLGKKIENVPLRKPRLMEYIKRYEIFVKMF